MFTNVKTRFLSASKSKQGQRMIFLSERHAISIIVLFFVLLTLTATTIIPPLGDSFYYWAWSKRLALSYYDGPPLIAYLIRFFTIIFGDTYFAINFFGVVTLYLTLFFIYKTALLLLNRLIALNVCLIWLISPYVIYNNILGVSYDNLANLFWAVLLYFAVSYIHSRSLVDLYAVGISTGLSLLSKYTGIILVLGLLAFIILTPNYWAMFKNKHFYFSIAIAFFIFSPVLIWNIQHEWASFHYQLTVHYSDNHLESVFTYLRRFLLASHLAFLFLIYGSIEAYHAIKHHMAMRLLVIVSYMFFFFFLYQSFSHKIAINYLTPFWVSGSILCGYFFKRYQLRKLFFILIIGGFLWNYVPVVRHGVLQDFIYSGLKIHDLIREGIKRYWRPGLTVVTENYADAAAISFWLPGHQSAYTLTCSPGNQYQYWSKPTIQQIKAKQIKEVLYLGSLQPPDCITEHFDICKALPSLMIEGNYLVGLHIKHKTEILFAYGCYRQ